MTQTINVLPDQLINKIAAGEVIEGPKNVVKELIENSIDANAQNIYIEVKNAGFQKILVEDDGFGMNKNDAKLCFQRHATSKIKNFEDLININSMGFRGEALASIAAISKIDLKTSQNETGTHLQLDAGKLLESKEIARTKGTSIEVKNLFYNVPVRKKFQKRISYLNSELIKTVTMLAFSYPKVGFKFILDETLVFESEKRLENNFKNFKKRVLDVFGKEFLKSCIDIEDTENNIEIFGFLGYPLSSKKTKKSQYLIVNNRAVVSPSISKFIKEAYSTRISEKEYPIFALHINIARNLIDVNVHPQKKEIRLREEVFIKETIKKIISKSLDPTYFEKEAINEIGYVKSNVNFSKPKDFLDNEIEKENIFKKFEKQMIFDTLFEMENRLENSLIVENYLLIETKYIQDIVDVDKQEKLAIFDLSAILFSHFFDKIKKRVQISSLQNLLVPIVIDLNKRDISFVENNFSLFYDLGFDIRIIATDKIAIDSAPDLIKKENIQDLFFLLLEEFQRYNKSDKIDELYYKNLAHIVSKFSKMKKEFTKADAIYLVSLQIKSKSFTDPLGRSILVKFLKEDLDKLFKKIW